jgi:hypothetical protein
MNKLSTLDGRTILVGVDDAPPAPIQIGSPERGDFRGYEVDLLCEMEKRLGTQLRYRRALWSVIVSELTSGGLDIVCSAATVTEERKHEVDFCRPHLEPLWPLFESAMTLLKLTYEARALACDLEQQRKRTSGLTARPFRSDSRNRTTSCICLSVKAN